MSTITTETETPIEKAVRLLGSQPALARALGVSPQAVYQWVRGVRPVPPGRCLAIEQACGGQVTVHDLRPDVFGVPKKNLEQAQGRVA